jgi:hypothetical protein
MLLTHSCLVGVGLYLVAAYPGQFSGSPPGQGQVPNGFYWTGGYWGYCPPPSPPVAAPAPPPPPGVLGTRAVIR